LLILSGCTAVQYQPDWKSLDSRPLPSWYDEAKFGIFVHWGLFSVPSYGCTKGGSAGEWYWWHLDGSKDPCLVHWHHKTYGENFQYADFPDLYQTPLFDPHEWASLFKQSGAKYVVFTTKHHDGYTHWRSPSAWNWNSVDTGPHQDHVRMMTDAVRKHD